jgi:hypothetical protein
LQGNAAQMTGTYELVYFPYIALAGVNEIRFGRTRVWNSRLLEKEIGDEQLRQRVAALLASHRLPPTSSKRASQPVSDMGVVSVGDSDFRPLSPAHSRETTDARCALFLACLSHNVGLLGPNAGFSTYTAENFDLHGYKIDLSSSYFAQSSGALIEIIHGGYRYGEAEFPTPLHVPWPTPFKYDEDLLHAVEHLRRSHGRLYRRVIRAASVFIESYYNTRSLDINARVLLQATAFEVLLDLPDTQQRLAFKNAIERLCNNKFERRYWHKYEVRGKKRADVRTQKGIWADRFYSLRNSIIHGDEVPRSRYHYGGQHHVWIAPLFFVACVKRLIAVASQSAAGAIRFFDRIDWVRGDAYGPELSAGGFRLELDWAARIADQLNQQEDGNTS